MSGRDCIHEMAKEQGQAARVSHPAEPRMSGCVRKTTRSALSRSEECKLGADPSKEGTDISSREGAGPEKLRDKFSRGPVKAHSAILAQGMEM